MSSNFWPFGGRGDPERNEPEPAPPSEPVAETPAVETPAVETQPAAQAQYAEPTGERSHPFRTWRRSRPFWGGLLLILAGAEIAAIPLMAWRIILLSTNVTLAAATGIIIAILGIVTWMTPSQNKLYGLLGILFGAVSVITSNLGGFIVGALITVIGGALTFAWTAEAPEVVVAEPIAPEEPAPPSETDSAPRAEVHRP